MFRFHQPVKAHLFLTPGKLWFLLTFYSWLTARKRPCFYPPHPPHSKTNVSAFHWLFIPKVSGQLSYDLFFSTGEISPEKRNSKFKTEFLFLFSPKLLTLLKWRASSSSFSHIWRYSKYESSIKWRQVSRTYLNSF
jgi:hypothetical protein